MDEYDAPRKRVPVEHYEECPDLKEIEEQTCLLFEEFLNLDDALLDVPLAVSQSALHEQADSPVYTKQSLHATTRARGLSLRTTEQKEALEGCDESYTSYKLASSDEDDVVADSAPSIAPPPPAPTAAIKPLDDKMKVLAKELAKAGDSLVNKYGNDVQDVESKLLQLVKQEAANLTYERFSVAVDDLVGKDKDWTNFVFAYCVGRRICKHSQDALLYTKSFFQRYVQSYSQTVHDSGGMEAFLRTRGSHTVPQ